VASLRVVGQSGIAQGLRALLLGAVGQNCWARATICAAEAGSELAVATGLRVGVGIGVAVGVGMAVGLVVSAPAPAAHPARTQTATSQPAIFRMGDMFMGVVLCRTMTLAGARTVSKRQVKWSEAGSRHRHPNDVDDPLCVGQHGTEVCSAPEAAFAFGLCRYLNVVEGHPGSASRI